MSDKTLHVDRTITFGLVLACAGTNVGGTPLGGGRRSAALTTRNASGSGLTRGRTARPIGRTNDWRAAIAGPN